MCDVPELGALSWVSLGQSWSCRRREEAGLGMLGRVQISREPVSHTNPDHDAKISGSTACLMAPVLCRRLLYVPCCAERLPQRPLWNTGLRPHFL